ncbi:MAG: GNAT family N-acetyltransferase [Treponema sp.]|nr:GNAT family N-acetyltransferase [Treponema sp.]
MLENTSLKPFNEKNLPLVIDVVEPLWSPPVGDAVFKRFNVEFIVRNNISENDYHFELVESIGNCDKGLTSTPVQADSKIASHTQDDNFLAAAFFTRKGDACKVEEWYEKECQRFPEELKATTNMSRTYLRQMDERTLSFMQEDDIKLSLFVSRWPGAGSLLLNQLCQKLKDEGWKNLFLWTDIDCNREWYEKHGFTLVEEGSYEPFSDEHGDYKTYIFMKKL